LKALAVPFLVLALFSAAGTAVAGGSYGHGYGSTSIFYGTSFSGHYGNNYASGYRGGGYHGRGYAHGARYGNYSHGYGSNNGWYFLGGMLLGGLLTHSYNSSRYSTTYASYPRTTYYQPYPVVEKRIVYSAPVVQTTRVARSAPQSQAVRRLHRDLEGRCYEIKFNDSGDELRFELPPSDCDWS